MRLLVTGGAGYIGSHASRLFREHGHDTWIYDNLSRGHREAVPGDRLVIGDLSNRALLDQTLNERRIEAVVHFAALTYVGESVQDPGRYYEMNVCGTANLLESIRACGVNRLVFSSTAAVYGDSVRIPIRESDPKLPINPYGRTKYVIEQMLADYSSAYGLGYAALRYFNAAGAHTAGDIGEDHTPETHLIPLVLQVALGQRPRIDIFGTEYATPDGTCVRDYVHVNDLARAHLQALDVIEPGSGLICNLGSGRGFSVKEVVAACREITGRRIEVKETSAREGDPAELVAAPDLAMQRLKWKPQSSDLNSIIETAWKWHLGHPQGYRS